MAKAGRKTNAEREIRSGEAKKLKKVAIKDVGGSEAVQMCLEIFKADEVLKLIPRDVPIEFLELSYIKRGKSQRVEAPKKLSEFGGIYHRVLAPVIDIQVKMVNVSVNEALNNLKEIAANYEIAPADFVVETLKLDQKGAVLVFRLFLKDIPATNDKRVKVRVLANTKISRDPALELKAKKILSNFDLKKYFCRYHSEEKRVAVCTREQ